MDLLTVLLIAAAILLAALVLSPTLLGLVIISEHQVGIVIKKFSNNQLPSGRLIALDGEAGYQAETMASG